MFTVYSVFHCVHNSPLSFVKLLVRNLPRSATETQLHELFSGYGKVQYCVVVTDKASGESKGFGFVEMPKPGEAKAAVKNLNGRELDGNKIRVKRTAPGSEPEPGKSDRAKPTQSRE